MKVAHKSKSDDPKGEHPYGVMLQLIDRVDWNSINEATLELFHLAQEVNVNYDGWETSVAKDA